MPAELRIYQIAAGLMEEFVSLFDDEVAPARRANGFEVIGPWIQEDENQFVWIAGYDGELSWDEAVQRYYERVAGATGPVPGPDGAHRVRRDPNARQEVRPERLRRARP